jgi:hypothetical protein
MTAAGLYASYKSLAWSYHLKPGLYRTQMVVTAEKAGAISGAV